MYKLTCPSCGHIASPPFVRIGAVATCESCHQRFQVQSRHVERTRREGATAPGSGGESLEPLGTGRLGGTATTDRLTAAADRMIDEASALAAAGAQVRSASPAKPTAARKRRGKWVGRSTVAWLVSVAGVAGMFIGGLLLFLWSTGLHDRFFEKGWSETPSAATPFDPSLREVDAELLGAENWLKVDQAPSEPPSDSVIDVVSSTLLPATDGSSGRVYLAQVRNRSHVGVEFAFLTLELINERERVYATCILPLVYLAPDGQQWVRVEVPSPLSDTLERVGGVSQVWKVIDDPLVLEGESVSLESRGEGVSTLTRVSVINTTGQTLGRVMVLIEALDADEYPLRRWRCEWRQPMTASERVEFLVRTPTPTPATPGDPTMRLTARAMAEPAP